MNNGNFIIDCIYVYEGENETIELDAKIDLITGIISDIETSDADDDIDFGDCLNECVEFKFEQKNYYLTVGYEGNNLCVKDRDNIALFQSIKSMLKLQLNYLFPILKLKKIRYKLSQK